MRRTVRAVAASTLLALLTLAVDALPQDKKPEAAPAASGQQDRVDIGATLDSWYKVIQGGDSVGYVHEVLARAQAGSLWRYRYDADAEVELMVPDPKDSKKLAVHTESLRIRATLDDAYAPVTMERSDNRDETQVTSNVINEDPGKRIDVVLGTNERKSFPVTGDEEIHYSTFLMFISLRQNGKLAKAGTQRAMLFAPREDDKPPITEVQLEVHELMRREYLGKKDVPVTRITYLKPPPAPTRALELQEAYVDKFGRIVEEITRGGLRRVLVKDEVEAVGRNERVRPGARRDPFRKDLAMLYSSSGIKTDKELKEAPPDPNNMAATFTRMETLIEEMRKAKDDKRDEEGQKSYDRFLEIQSAVRNLNQVKPLPAEQLARVESLRKQAEEVWGGLDRLMKGLQQTYVKIIAAYGKDECEVMETGIAEFKKAQGRKELEDQPQMAQLLKWIGELEPLVGKCRTRLELGKKKIILTGTMLHEESQIIPVDASVNFFGHQIGGTQEVRFVKPSRIAVINDKMYRVGDMIEGEGVRLEKISAFGVQVSLREEVREVGIRQK